eukprot:1883932-Amphidinium_carterae.1
MMLQVQLEMRGRVNPERWEPGTRVQCQPIALTEAQKIVGGVQGWRPILEQKMVVSESHVLQCFAKVRGVSRGTVGGVNNYEEDNYNDENCDEEYYDTWEYDNDDKIVAFMKGKAKGQRKRKEKGKKGER